MRHITNLRADLEISFEERDCILSGIPNQLQVAIISLTDLTCLYNTDGLMELLFPDSGGKDFDAMAISYEKFKD